MKSVATGMGSVEIKRRWNDFFERRNHTVVPSAPLVSNDPTLLFTVAGMVPFAPYLSGAETFPHSRVASVQKCIRTNDIEMVGKTPRHGTFFQMCGNFSFGDYFKEEAIRFAWELLTTSETDGGLGFDPKDLWVTVYEEDHEALTLWQRHTMLPDYRIQPLGKDTNYWSTGQAGPAGPCSEIFYDLGPEYGMDGGPATDDDRYVEIWNLVFMQHRITNVKSKTDFTIAGELPNKNIDTGMGLERVAFIKQGLQNIYEIDQVRPVLDRVAELAGKTYGADHDDDVRLRVVADHVRSSLMLIADGVTPSNGGRGYILRRLLRRTVRSMRLLGIEGPSFAELFPVSRDAMKAAYPEVEHGFDFISRVAYAEERVFLRTLASGSRILKGAVEEAKNTDSEVPGSTAFLLHDTYGFPIELTLEIAEESGVKVNCHVFASLMREQRDRAKADALAKKGQRVDLSVYKELSNLGETTFVGHEELNHESRVLGIVVDGEPVLNARKGQTAEIVLAETSLWAESGGQDSDQGVIIGDGFELEVLGIRRPLQGLTVHTVRVQFGDVRVGQDAATKVDAVYRQRAQQAHSATHIVHTALREVLGEGARRVGSLNRAGYLRIDYKYDHSVSAASKKTIEELANRAIRDNFPVKIRKMRARTAKEMGAIAICSQKHSGIARVVDIGEGWSREICDGTHVSSSAEVGLISLISEGSFGASLRRLEALVGFEAYQNLAAERDVVRELTAKFKVPREEVVSRVNELSTRQYATEKKLAQLQAAQLDDRIPEMLANSCSAGRVRYITSTIGSAERAEDLRDLAARVRDLVQSEPAVIVIASDVSGKPVLVAATTRPARDAGVRAGDVVRTGARVLGGGGGGRPDLAQGGGSDVTQIDAALVAIRQQLLQL